MNQNKLPADPTAMTLGIIALSIVVVGFCCGPVAFVALVLSIIGLVSATKSLKEFDANHDAYSPKSRSNVATGKILNIIALCLSGLVSIFWIIYFMIYGAIISSAIMNADKLSDYNDDSYYEWEDETDDYQDEDAVTESDTMYIDSINIDKINEVEIDTIQN